MNITSPVLDIPLMIGRSSQDFFSLSLFFQATAGRKMTLSYTTVNMILSTAQLASAVPEYLIFKKRWKIIFIKISFSSCDHFAYREDP
jgi:hypothetical protein